jgi:hypothetical protein
MLGIHKDLVERSGTEYANGEYVVSMWFSERVPAERAWNYFQGILEQDWKHVEWHDYGVSFLVRLRFKVEKEGD